MLAVHCVCKVTSSPLRFSFIDPGRVILSASFFENHRSFTPTSFLSIWNCQIPDKSNVVFWATIMEQLTKCRIVIRIGKSRLMYFFFIFMLFLVTLIFFSFNRPIRRRSMSFLYFSFELFYNFRVCFGQIGFFVWIFFYIV